MKLVCSRLSEGAIPKVGEREKEVRQAAEPAQHGASCLGPFVGLLPVQTRRSRIPLKQC